MDNDPMKSLSKHLDDLARAKKALDEQDRIMRLVTEESAIQKLAKQYDHIKNLSSPASSLLKHLDEIEKHKVDALTSLNRAFLENTNGQTALSILQEATRSREKDISGFLDAANALDRTLAAYSKRFVAPKFSLADLAANDIRESVSDIVRRYGESLPTIQRAMVSMKTPWVDTLQAAQSIRGFAEIQAIGYDLNAFHSFDARFTARLRTDLGDWRDVVTMQPDSVSEPLERTAIYVEHGLNTELTDFPESAFQESLSIAGLKRELPALIAIYGPPVPSLELWSEEELARNNEAHNWLQRLEMQIRHFIDKVMASAFGEGWEKHRLPGGFYDAWMVKKQKATSAGEPPCPLIAYADFTDYVPLMCKKDNWPIFAPFFDRTDSLRESFQRLYPIRIGTMHARKITQDDQLYLFVEARRLMNAILKPRQKT